MNVLFSDAECPPDSHRHKTVNLGLFYTEQFYTAWKAINGDGGDAAVLSSVQGLASSVGHPCLLHICLNIYLLLLFCRSHHIHLLYELEATKQSLRCTMLCTIRMYMYN